jgi:erythromycin esterase-like protein
MNITKSNKQKINYKNFIMSIKDKKIIGIGENLHGANFSFSLRKKIIISLLKYNKKIIICLEENNDALKKLNISNFFPMHQSEIFMKFYKFCIHNKIKVIGIDNYESENRNNAMYENIIAVNKKYPKYQLIFLAFDTHVSNYHDFSKNWKPNVKSYDTRTDVGYKLRANFGSNYISIGLIVKKGNTVGKTDEDGSKLVTFYFENTKDIFKMESGIYI